MTINTTSANTAPANKNSARTMTQKPVWKSPLVWVIGAFSIAILALLINYLATPRPTPLLAAPVPVEIAELPETAPVVEPEPEPEPVYEPPVYEPTEYEVILANLGLTDAELAELPRPVINTILPAGLPTAAPADLLPLAAVPKYELTPGVIEPGGEPVLALENYSDLVIEPIAARWTVVGLEPGAGGNPGWVKVMVPVGRGALPSVNPAEVNHQAVWVPEAAVELEPETLRVEVSISNRSLTVYDGDEELASFHVGVGIIGRTDTPLGLCSVIARVIIQTGAESLLTNCQSERLDGFAGANWATVAVHEGAGFSQATGGAVSNGCVRVPPAKFRAYLDHLNVGTPVIVLP